METQGLKIQMNLYRFSCWLHVSALVKIYHWAIKIHKE